MVIKNDSDATTKKKNTIAIYPAEDTAAIQGIIKT
jgi:hypothetical protein